MLTVDRRFVRRISIALGLAACLAPRAGWAAAPRPTLTDVRHTVAQDRTRVVLSLSGQPRYEIRAYKTPDRIAVNLPDVAAAPDLGASEIERGVVRRVRINRLPWGTQVVFDLRSAAAWDERTLDSVDGMPDRIVVDVLAPGSGQAKTETTGGDRSVIEGAPGEDTPPAAQAEEPRAGSTSGAGEAASAEERLGTERRGGSDPGRVLVVAVDAGHGGKDWGAKGK